MAASSFNPAEWAKEQQGSQIGTDCATCASPRIADAIRTVLVLMAEGKSRASIPSMHKMLRTHYDYKLSENGLRGHIKRCEIDLWTKVIGFRRRGDD